MHLFYVLCLLCLCACLSICGLWSTAGKGLTSMLSFVVSSCEFVTIHWYLGSGVVLDCIDSWSVHPYLLTCINPFSLKSVATILFIAVERFIQVYMSGGFGVRMRQRMVVLFFQGHFYFFFIFIFFYQNFKISTPWRNAQVWAKPVWSWW